ncbi:MAG: GNAT family N-acetyltransferase [Cyanobacteria bacterium P01_A01_bin.114]
MQYLIRLAERGEVGKLPAIERAAAQLFYGYLSELELTSDKLDEIVSLPFLLRAQSAGQLWVATAESQINRFADAQPIGFVVGRPLLKSFFIVEIDVLPSYARLGIGTALMRTVCDYAQTQGFGLVTLTTFRYTPWNIPFYESLGFEVIPEAALSEEMQNIVEHEERYGFKRQHRAVMQAVLSPEIVSQGRAVSPLTSPTPEKDAQTAARSEG